MENILEIYVLRPKTSNYCVFIFFLFIYFYLIEYSESVGLLRTMFLRHGNCMLTTSGFKFDTT